MATFRPNVRMEMVDGQAVISSGEATPSAGELRVSCPRCGSPYLATPGASDPSGLLADFVCVAGDCGFSGSVSKE